MNRKCHNDTLQTNPCHHEEESKEDNSVRHSAHNKSKGTSSLYPSEMIAILESTQSTAKHNKDLTLTPPQTISCLMTSLLLSVCVQNNPNLYMVVLLCLVGPTSLLLCYCVQNDQTSILLGCFVQNDQTSILLCYCVQNDQTSILLCCCVQNDQTSILLC